MAHLIFTYCEIVMKRWELMKYDLSVSNFLCLLEHVRRLAALTNVFKFMSSASKYVRKELYVWVNANRAGMCEPVIKCFFGGFFSLRVYRMDGGGGREFLSRCRSGGVIIR